MAKKFKKILHFKEQQFGETQILPNLKTRLSSNHLYASTTFLKSVEVKAKEGIECLQTTPHSFSPLRVQEVRPKVTRFHQQPDDIISSGGGGWVRVVSYSLVVAISTVAVTSRVPC